MNYLRSHPRFSGEALVNKLPLVDRLSELVVAKGISGAQLAGAWGLVQGDDVVPIPGTKRRRWLHENIAAVDIELSVEDVSELAAAIPSNAVRGHRYP